MRLVVIGDGEARDALVARATDVNRRRGRGLIKLAGAEPDPREAYAAADIVLGMGSSALRAMAMGKPVVVQGERGFARVLQPSTLPLFLRQGFWGIGDRDSRENAVESLLVPLLESPALRGVLGAFGRQTVEERFSLVRATETLLHLYDIVVQQQVHRHQVHAVSVAARALGQEIDNHRPTRKRQLAKQRAEILSQARLAQPSFVEAFNST